MIYKASEFVFKAPPAISRARRVLIKPSASYPAAYPVTTSPDMLAGIIRGIRQISDADIILLEGTPGGGPVRPIYKSLGYDFPRVLTLDVKDCVCVEVDNPLLKPLAVPTFWVPNVILSSDYLITTTPPKAVGNQAHMSIVNLLSLLPASKYCSDGKQDWHHLHELGIDNVLADLYFTLPFDLAIVEGSQMLTTNGDPTKGEASECGKMFVGEPFEVDSEASESLGISANYLKLIEEARAELEE